MTDREHVIKALEEAIPFVDSRGYGGVAEIMHDALSLLKEKEQEAIKPTINEYGEAYCVCGENVGIIPSNKNLPSVLMKYCPECGRKMKWDAQFAEIEQESVPAIRRKVMHMLVWCCGSCGVAITEGDKFCRMCGKKVKWNDSDNNDGYASRLLP